MDINPPSNWQSSRSSLRLKRHTGDGACQHWFAAKICDPRSHHSRSAQRTRPAVISRMRPFQTALSACSINAFCSITQLVRSPCVACVNPWTGYFTDPRFMGSLQGDKRLNPTAAPSVYSGVILAFTIVGHLWHRAEAMLSGIFCHRQRGRNLWRVAKLTPHIPAGRRLR